MNDTKNSGVEVVYNFGTHEQRGSLDGATPVYITAELAAAPVAWWPANIAGEMQAREWAEYAPKPGSLRGAYVRHNNRAIPVRLVTGGAL